MIGLTNDGVSQKGKLIKHDGAVLDDGKRRRSRRRSKKSRRSVKKSRRSAKKSRRSRRSKKSRRSAKKSRRSAKKSRRSARKSRRSAKKSRRSRRSKKHDGMTAQGVKAGAIQFAKKNGISMKYVGALSLILMALGGSIALLRRSWKKYENSLNGGNGGKGDWPGFYRYLRTKDNSSPGSKSIFNRIREFFKGSKGSKGIPKSQIGTEMKEIKPDKGKFLRDFYDIKK